MESKQDDNDSKPSLMSLVFSTMAAAFGVQSNRNRERDFKHGNLWVFIAAGVIFTGVFVLVVFSIVKTVLSSQGV